MIFFCGTVLANYISLVSFLPILAAASSFFFFFFPLSLPKMHFSEWKWKFILGVEQHFLLQQMFQRRNPF